MSAVEDSLAKSVMGMDDEVVSVGTPLFSFDQDFQSKIAALAIHDPKFVRKTTGLINPEYFEDYSEAFLVNAVSEYYQNYRRIPREPSVLAQVLKDAFTKSKTREDLRREVIEKYKILRKITLEDCDYVADKVAEFARHQAIQNAYVQSANMLEKGRYEEAQKLMEKAFRTGVAGDFEELDYWNDIDRRKKYRIDKESGLIKPNGISTGIPKMDKLLYHKGWGRKELSVIMGAAKKGKSTGLGHFGVKASSLGYHALYVTLEVAKDIIAERTDANVSGVPINELTSTRIVEASEKVLEASDREDRGHYKIVEFASGSLSPSMLRRVLEKYRADGIIFDLIIVDYADIMRPDHLTNDAIENSKNVWLGLRAIAFEEDAALLTATQTNRDGFKSDTAKAEHVAEDFNKVRIADLLISINRTDEEREKGEARLFFAASRNQGGEFSIHIKQDMAAMRFVTSVISVS